MESSRRGIAPLFTELVGVPPSPTLASTLASRVSGLAFTACKRLFFSMDV